MMKNTDLNKKQQQMDSHVTHKTRLFMVIYGDS